MNRKFIGKQISNCLGLGRLRGMGSEWLPIDEDFFMKQAKGSKSGSAMTVYL